MKSLSRPWLSILTSFFLILAPVGIPTGAPDPAPQEAAAPQDSSAPRVTQINRRASLQDAAIRTPDGRLRVIVQLTDAPLATYQGGIPGLNATNPAWTGAAHLDAESPDSLAYIAYLKSAQAAFMENLSQTVPDASLVASFQAAFNGLSLAVPETGLPGLARMAGVAAIYPDQLRSVDMDASLPLINAPAMWAALGGQSSAGKGIKIADVDTGLRPNNPMFSGAGFTLPTGVTPKGFCATNPNDPQFPCNNKIIAAWAFPDNALAVAAEETALQQGPNPIPLDIDGHGSHTAGISAGDPVTVKAGATIPVDTTISGVAPGAYLMVYKALFETPNHTGASGTDTSLLAAFDQIIKDGADVINNSWGSSLVSDPNQSVERPAIDALTKAGVLVVFSAGNGGPFGGTISCPGCVENALTVASSATARLFANPVSVTGPAPVPANLTGLAGLQGTGPALISDINAGLRYVPSGADGCTPFASGAFSGAVALLVRGTCNFSVKVNDVLAAGAVAVVVVNNVPGQPVMMGSLDKTTIPSLMIGQVSGQRLISWVLSNPAAAIHLSAAKARLTNPAWQDVMSSFSSVGPDGDPDVLKPDITAPGQLILSAYSPALINGAADPYYALLQGTSMAAPAVTGAAALLKQQHPTWDAIQLKTALTSTSVQTPSMPDSSSQAGPFNMGAGRLDLARASLAGLTFDRASFASSDCVVTCHWTGILKNVSLTRTETWKAAISTGAGLALLVSPRTFSLPPGGSGSYTLTAVTSGLAVGSWGFGTLIWNDASRTYSSAIQPVAVLSGATANQDAIFKQADQAHVALGGVLTYTLRMGNPYTTAGKFTITDTIPSNARYILDSTTNGMGNPVNNVLTATKQLGGLVASISVAGGPDKYIQHPPNPANDLILSTVCPTPCQDTLINVSPVDFYYMGLHYTTMGISSNGYLMPGGWTSPSDNSSASQVLPNKARPNNVIAPLWSHLVMKGSGQGDTHTGLWMVWTTGGYTVYDWQQAQSADPPGDTYSFQVWIKDGAIGPDNITFAYGTLGSLTAHNFTVGLENDDGAQGMTYYNEAFGTATGVPPVQGQNLRAANEQSFVTYNFRVQAEWSDLTHPSIINVATATNDLIPTDQPSAVAVTPLDLYRSFMPLVGNQ